MSKANTKTKRKTKPKAKPEVSMLTMARRNLGGKNAIDFANSKYGAPLTNELASILYMYGFDGEDLGKLLTAIVHPIHLFVKYPL